MQPPVHLFLALCAVPLAWAPEARAQLATPPVSGVYKAEFSKEQGRGEVVKLPFGPLSVTVAAGDPAWVTGLSMAVDSEGRVVVDGVMQGLQFVGRLLVSPRCRNVVEERIIDFTASWLPAQGMFVGYLSLESACGIGSAGPGGTVRVALTRDPDQARPAKLGTAAQLEQRAAAETAGAAAATGERARRAWLRAISWAPTARNYARAGEALLDGGDVDRALPLLERGAALQPVQWEPQLQLARLWLRRNDRARAMAALRAAVDARMPQPAEVLNQEEFLALRELPEYPALLAAVRAGREGGR